MRCRISVINSLGLEKLFLIIGFKSEIMLCVVINFSVYVKNPIYRSPLTGVLTVIGLFFYCKTQSYLRWDV